MAPPLPAGSAGGKASSGAGSEADPSPRVGRLDTAEALRVELARLYRAGRRGDIAPGDASKLASILELIRRSLDASDHEARLRAVEEHLGRSRYGAAAPINRSH